MSNAEVKNMSPVGMFTMVKMKKITVAFLVLGLVFFLANAAQAATAYAVFSFFNSDGKCLETHKVANTGNFTITSTTGLFKNFGGTFNANTTSTIKTTAAAAPLMALGGVGEAEPPAGLMAMASVTPLQVTPLPGSLLLLGGGLLGLIGLRWRRS